MQGTCKEWDDNKGYGTITGDDGTNYFCHFSAIQSTDITLDVGELVEFEPGKESSRGMQATLVKRI
jgi:CspA family cold shock protein